MDQSLINGLTLLIWSTLVSTLAYTAGRATRVANYERLLDDVDHDTTVIIDSLRHRNVELQSKLQNERIRNADLERRYKAVYERWEHDRALLTNSKDA